MTLIKDMSPSERREYNRLNMKIYRENHPEKKSAAVKYYKRWKLENPEKYKAMRA